MATSFSSLLRSSSIDTEEREKKNKRYDENITEEISFEALLWLDGGVWRTTAWVLRCVYF